MVALNEREKKVIFVEVKWRTLRKKDVKEILRSLEKVAELTGLIDYEKYFGIIAKSVSPKGELTWDLRDFSLLR